MIGQAVGVELDLGAIASAAVNAATNGLKMDTYYPQEVISYTLILGTGSL